MNNQYKGPTAWDDYLSALEAATPTIQAIAVTDYYVLDAYLEVLKHKAAGRPGREAGLAERAVVNTRLISF